MKTTITLFFLLASLNLYSQPYWMWENPRPIGARKTNCIFLNDLTYIVIGEYGTIIKTTNGGASWYQIEPKTQEDLRYIYFINSTTGFVCGENGALLKSTNAGENWIFISPTNKYLSSIYFLNDNTGFLGGAQTFLKTTDQGITWSNVLDTGMNGASGMIFPNNQTGYAATTGGIIKTSNSGINWTFHLLSSAATDKFAFISPDSGFLLMPFSGGNIFQTTNGSDWFIQNINTTGIPRDIEFINNSTGFISCSSNNSIMRTTNSGLNWLPINIGQYIPEFDWLNETTVLSIGSLGNPGSDPLSVFRSTNAAANWFEVYSDSGVTYKINAIAYADSNHGVAVCDSGRVIYTNNGLWSELSIGLPLSVRLDDVEFINSSTGFLCGNGLTFLKTTNKGANWSNAAFPELNVSMSVINFTNELTGYAAGGNQMYKTTNAGLNWIAKTLPLANPQKGVHFVDDNTGIVVGAVIFRTINGGDNWTHMGSSLSASDMIFFNNMTGYIAGESKRTTNGGLNWVYIDSVNSYRLARINTTSCVTLTQNQYTFKITTDAGLTWQPFSHQPNSEDLTAITYIPNGHFVVGGEEGCIMRTTGPGILLNTEPISSEIPTKYLLRQNYPNPFNPVTKIKYDVPYRSNVKISIFDISGREIRTLINNFRDPGKYEIIFDGSGLPSGVYFYRILTDDFSQTRKMILLK